MVNSYLVSRIVAMKWSNIICLFKRVMHKDLSVVSRIITDSGLLTRDID